MPHPLNIKKLTISLLLPQLAGLLGSVFTAPAIPSWYQSLKKPSFNPPSYVFGPVWITLYFLIGISLYLVWSQKPTRHTKNALKIFFLQLALNSLWSIVFFGFQALLSALTIILILLALIILTILKFRPLSRPAALILIPYLLWVTFASYLNFSIYQLNK